MAASSIALCLGALLAASLMVQPAYGERSWDVLVKAITGGPDPSGIRGPQLNRTSAGSSGVTSATASGFPLSAKVSISLTGPYTKLMRDLRVGEKVVVYDPIMEEVKLEEVLSIDRQDLDTPVEYLTLYHEEVQHPSIEPSSYEISIKPDQWVFSEGAPNTNLGYITPGPQFPGAATLRQASSLEPEAADKVWVRLWNTSAGSGADEAARVVFANVLRTELSTERGLVFIQTASGTIFVNGVLTTTYSASSTLPPHLDAMLEDSNRL